MSQLDFNVIKTDQFHILDLYLEYTFYNRSCLSITMEKYIQVVDYVITVRGKLYWNNLNDSNGMNALHWIFSNKLFNAQMLNYLWEKDPQLDIECEDAHQRSPLFLAIVESPRLLELLQVIKSNLPTNSIIKIKTSYSNRELNSKFVNAINRYACDSNQFTICALIELCGELFPLIEIKNLTQDICNHFYSSKYFKWSPDQDSLIKLIPEQFQTNLRNVNPLGRKTKPALRAQLEFE
jgi:hypothetical protein